MGADEVSALLIDRNEAVVLLLIVFLCRTALRCYNINNTPFAF